MLTRGLVAATALAVTVMSSQAAGTNVEWRGVLTVSAVSAVCVIDYPIGSNLLFRYRVAGLGSNGANDRLSVYQTFYAQGFVGNGVFTKTATAVKAIGIGGNGGGTFANAAKLAITSRSPATPTATTKAVDLVGSITNFEDVSGCNVSFYGSGTLKIF